MEIVFHLVDPNIALDALSHNPKFQRAMEINRRIRRSEARLIAIVDRCLSNLDSYQLFDALASVSKLPLEDKRRYIEIVRDSREYTEREIGAIERLVCSGSAFVLKQIIDEARDRKIQEEIEEMLR